MLVVQGATTHFQSANFAAPRSTRPCSPMPRPRARNGKPNFAPISPPCSTISVIDDAVDHGRPLELPPRYGSRSQYAAFTDARPAAPTPSRFASVKSKGPRRMRASICDVVRGPPGSVRSAHRGRGIRQLWRGNMAARKIIGDNYAGAWVANAFADAGIEYEVCPLPKSQLYLEALPLFNRGAVSLPNARAAPARAPPARAAGAPKRQG